MTDTAAPQTDLVGRLLDDRYRLEAVIARGGMATVYRALDTRLDRVVAVKVMHRALADDPEFVRRFTREAQSTARLSVPEVVAIHDQGTDSSTGLAYLVMEHVQGVNLRQVLLRHGAFSPQQACEVVVSVLRALASAHGAGLVHRDIKPENVLMADDGRVKVADFGLARALAESNLTQTGGLLMGTVNYLSPEQVEGRASDARSDVYSTGVLLFELLTGTPPFTGETPTSVMYQHARDRVPAPSSRVGGLSPELDEVVLAATAREPDRRPADGAAFLARLQAAVPSLLGPRTPVPVQDTAEHQLTTTLPAVDEPAPPVRPRRRRRGLVATLVVLVLALLALGGGWYAGVARYTHAPGVLGMKQAAATTRLRAAGFTVKLGSPAYSESIASDDVVTQSPGPSSRLRKHGVVTLVISRGPDRRVVPQLSGRTTAFATAYLTHLGLTVGAPSSEYNATIAKNAVIRTTPAQGTKLKPGTAVSLVISQGPKPIAVPNEVGQSSARAAGALKALGFVVATTSDFSDTVPSGAVISQDPAAGIGYAGSTITLDISKGPDTVQVPKVGGTGVDQARQLLEAAGLQVHTQTVFPGGPGNVIKQSPSGGSTVKRGSTVTLYIF